MVYMSLNQQIILFVLKKNLDCKFEEIRKTF